MIRLTRLLRLLPLLVIAASCIVTMTAQSKPTFEVTSVKRRPPQTGPPAPPTPSRTGAGAFYRPGITVARLIQFAYDVPNLQVSDGPEWIRRDSFEINAKATNNAPLAQMRLMVQSLLEERFSLVVRREEREMRHYVMSRESSDRLGLRLKKCDDPDTPSPPRPVRVPPGAAMPLAGTCAPLSSLVIAATGMMGSPVIDRTGLTGFWTYDLVYSDSRELTGREKELAERENVPAFDTAMREQLGLKLESARGPVDVIVIESVEPPAEN